MRSRFAFGIRRVLGSTRARFANSSLTQQLNRLEEQMRFAQRESNRDWWGLLLFSFAGSCGVALGHVSFCQSLAVFFKNIFLKQYFVHFSFNSYFFFKIIFS